MAKNFYERPSGLLWPRIDWGGDGPGFVESELALVPFAVSRAFRFVGSVEWPGQLLSLVCTALAGLSLEHLLRRRYGPVPALVGLGSWLASRGIVFSATAVQPDLASLAFSVLALVLFLRYIETARARAAALSCVALLLAAVIKPTALQLGVVEFVLVAIMRRDLFRRPATWIAWASVLLGVGAMLYHARGIYLSYGNTFGVLSGGDRKMPTLHQLVDPLVLLRACRVSLHWGIGFAGALAALFLVLFRRLDALEVALAAGITALVLFALRYTSVAEYGAHYHLPATLLGAVLVAHAAAQLRLATRSTVTKCAVALSFVASFAYQAEDRRRIVRRGAGDGSAPFCEELAALVLPGELVVVRSGSAAWEPSWNVPNNFQDPRIFYAAHVRGWVLPSDTDGSAELSQWVNKGARFYVEFGEHVDRPALSAFLAANAVLAYDDEVKGGRIWRLASPTAPSPSTVSLP